MVSLLSHINNGSTLLLVENRTVRSSSACADGDMYISPMVSVFCIIQLKELLHSSAALIPTWSSILTRKPQETAKPFKQCMK